MKLDSEKGLWSRIHSQARSQSAYTTQKLTVAERTLKAALEFRFMCEPKDYEFPEF
jgi:hypothetical protein